MRGLQSGQLSFHEALREIARLPALERRLLCRAATVYLSSPAAYGMMSMLGELPENHPRKLASKQRVGYAVIHLLQLGVPPREVLALAWGAQFWYELELS